ncbi:hypothetical protein CRG98_001753 [Punica granatum]|uniref:Uncharacterized protein n=1 Tax=Punica granatum TaxID=22663 RepID=A0A2I0LCE4_PUNGR|nr:hypothetical protein CRG98_001753 [Punica granatum]
MVLQTSNQEGGILKGDEALLLSSYLAFLRERGEALRLLTWKLSLDVEKDNKLLEESTEE